MKIASEIDSEAAVARRQNSNQTIQGANSEQQLPLDITLNGQGIRHSQKPQGQQNLQTDFSNDHFHNQVSSTPINIDEQRASTGQLLHLPQEIKGGLRRREDYVNRLLRNAVHSQTQCLKKQTTFYKQIAGITNSPRHQRPSQLPKTQLETPTQWKGEDPEISVVVQWQGSTQSNFGQQLDLAAVTGRVSVQRKPVLMNDAGTTNPFLLQTQNYKNTRTPSEGSHLGGPMTSRMRGRDLVKSFDGSTNKDTFSPPAIYNNQNKLGTPQKGTIAQRTNEQRYSSLCRLHKLTGTNLNQSSTDVARDTWFNDHPKMKKYNFKKLTPLALQTQGRDVSLPRKVIEFSNYKAYQEYAGITPNDEKLDVLDAIRSDSKLEILLRKRHHQANEETTVDQTSEETRSVMGAISMSGGDFTKHLSSHSQQLNQESSTTLPSIHGDMKAWINFMPRSSIRTNDQHRARRQQQDDLEAQIRVAEAQIKERRRLNEKLYRQMTNDKRKLALQLEKQYLVEDLQRQEQESQVQTRDISLNTAQVGSLHNLYTNLISKELHVTAESTKHQIEFGRETYLKFQEQVEQLQEANCQLTKNIKFCCRAIVQEQQAWFDQQKSLFLEFNKDSGHHLSKSMLDQTSQTGSQAGTQNGDRNYSKANKQDILKVEKISRHVNQMLLSKKAIDCALNVINSCKDAFPNLKRATIFVVDCPLQEIIANRSQQRYWREVPCDGPQNGVAIGVSRTIEDHCAPVFRDTQTGSKLFFSNKVISVPVLNPDNDKLMMTLQIETDADLVVQKPAPTKPAKSSFGQQAKQSDSGSHSGKSQMTFLYGNKKGGQNAGGWSKSDLIIVQMIALLGFARFEVFADMQGKELKQSIQHKTVQFVKRFMNFRNFKEILRSIKSELPYLMGFQAANIYLHDPAGKNLFSISINDESNTSPEKQAVSFESEFVVDETQIVRFPCNMGVNGFAFQNNSINYFNKCEGILGGVRKFFSSVYSVDARVVPENVQAALGKQLGPESPFNAKSDNFLDIETIHNMAICALQDEEEYGQPVAVGTLQLYNRSYNEIGQLDLARMTAVRKLIGSSLVKCAHYSTTLQTVVGLAMRDEALDVTQAKVDTVIECQKEGSTQTLSQSVMAIIRNLDQLNGGKDRDADARPELPDFGTRLQSVLQRKVSKKIVEAEVNSQ